MKFIFFLGFIIFTAPFTLFCQDETLIEINFIENQDLPELDNLLKKNTYRIKISNINRFVYDISSELSEKNLHTELPSIFSNFKLPPFLQLKTPIQGAETLSGVSPGIDEKINGEMRTTLFNEAFEPHDTVFLSTIYKAFSGMPVLDNFLNHLALDCSSSFDEISTKVKVATELYLDAPQSNQHELLKNDLLFLILGIDLIKESIKDTRKAFMNSDSILTKNDTLWISKSLTLIDSLNSQDAQAKYIKFLEKYEQFNEANFSFVSPPFKPDADFIDINLKVSAEKLTTCNKQKEIKLKKSYPVKGGLKIDYSVGAFSSFSKDDDFFGRKLNYISVDSSYSQIVSSNAGSRALLSIGALAHIYKRNTSKNFRFAGSIGMSTTSGFDNINLHGGLSGLVGKKNRAIITIGLTLREAEILDRNYAYDTNYLTSFLPETPPSIGIFPKFGWFVSFTYNLSKKT